MSLAYSPCPDRKYSRLARLCLQARTANGLFYCTFESGALKVKELKVVFSNLLLYKTGNLSDQRCRPRMFELLYRKLAKICHQSRLLRRHLMAKLLNLGWCSKTLQIDKDVSFHLRPCLVDLKVKWQFRRSKTKAS